MNLKALGEAYTGGGKRYVLITEVTRMGNGDVCVAGLDIHTGMMVRPLQTGGQNWEEDKWVAQGYLVPGNLLLLTPASAGNPAYPHATEDFRVSKVGYVTSISAADLYSICVEAAVSDIDTIFDGKIIDNKYVTANTHCRSLGSIVVPVNKLKAQAPFGKPQISFKDDWGIWHNLTVTELQTKNAGDAEAGAAALSLRLRNSPPGLAVLRLGLARAWGGANQEYDPPRCYLQLNGLILPA